MECMSLRCMTLRAKQQVFDLCCQWGLEMLVILYNY